MTKTVPELLASLGEIYAERNKLYGSNYKLFGHVLKAMFPDGVTLKTEEDFNRFALFVQIAHKLTRYARSVGSGGHPDSLDDMAVYAQMLQEYDSECRNAGEPVQLELPLEDTRARLGV